MILLINAKRIYRGFDSTEFNSICAKLKENGIEVTGGRNLSYVRYKNIYDEAEKIC